ncbi:MAG: hypothetical protein ACXVH3_36805 [Solirubrobacteraceae bacterium]
MPAHKTLNEVKAALVVALGGSAAIGAVAARVALRTGVNINNPKPEHASDPAVVEKVCSCLKDMGYAI